MFPVFEYLEKMNTNSKIRLEYICNFEISKYQSFYISSFQILTPTQIVPPSRIYWSLS